ncbi:MAG: Repressor in ring oxydation complex/ phenylacetic acid degradation pathway related protein (PaaX) [Candidatus Azambacteria bacterium GW2011_GWC2_45_7b]|nr:MAG: repressor in ring oxydation complex/phenylacetic acid degradation pathway related protein (PaaX), phenylacetic acid degradation operon negative regulatory protein [Parcubacteria group bacterium GW2011_GWC1_44_10]KKT59133.1 MAG: Repressor in ring oxydation complex/ phenylacetic acid degradation pathway related protein (PaaX) [Candidatus Giovannonibacteria bacterium GW2011_GWA1_44_25]KKU11967.1 MAG: Repressor in ring oxydation complex/ phenylacetic acid degradation pathway related protein (
MPKHKPIYFADPKISDEVKDRVREFVAKHPIASSTIKALLATAILGGVLTIAAVAPGIVAFAGKGLAMAKKNKQERYQNLWARFHALKKRNVFECVGESPNGGLIYRFTESGRDLTKKLLLETLEIKSSSKWDKKWHVVVFDIPEKYKKARYALWSQLKNLGFYQLQRSVWVHPFPCEHEIKFLCDIFNIHPFVEVFTTEDLNNGKILYHFKSILRKTV